MRVPDNLSYEISAEEIYHIVADHAIDWEELRASDGTLIYTSPSCERISGYRPEEFYAIHHLLFDRIHPSDKEMVMAHHEKIRQHPDQSHLIVFRLVHRDGGMRWIERHTQPVFLSDGSTLVFRNSIRDITARKQAEFEALRNYQTVLALLDNPMAIALILNLDGSIHMANQTFARRFGMSQSDLIGKVAWDLLPEPVREKRKQSFQQVLQTGQLVRYQDPGVHAYYDSILYPIHDENGQLFQIGVMARDITEIMEGRAALEESEATIRSLIDVPSTIMLLLDVQGRIITANAAFVEMLRAALSDTPDAETLKGQIFWDILPQQFADRRKAGFEKVLQSRQPLHVEERSPTGLWYDTWVYPVLNKEGEVTRIAVVGHEITDRKQAEKTIRQNEATIRAVMNVPEVMIALLDLQGAILEVNQTWAEIMHGSPESFKGKYLFDLFPPEIARYRRTVFEQVIQSGKMHRALDTGRNNRVFDSLVYPILDTQGQIKQVAVMSRDLTEIQKTAEELEKSQQHLKTLLSHIPGLLFVFDPQGTIKLVEGKILEQLRVDPKMLVGLNIADAMGPAYDPKPYLEKIVSGKMLWEELVFGDFTYDLYFSRIMDQENQVIEIIGVALDKTELKKSQLFLSNVLDNLPGILFVLDPGGSIKLIEGSALNKMGLSPKEMIGRKPGVFLGLSNETNDPWITKVLSGELAREEIAFGDYTYESTYSLIMDQNSQVAEIIGVSLDKTEEKKAQVQLQQVKDQLQVVLEGVADGIIATNQARQVIYANQAAAQMAGFSSADELTSTHADDLISQFHILDHSGQAIPRQDLPGQRSFSGVRKSPIELHLRNKQSSKELWVEVKDTPITDEKGQVQLVVTVFHDITNAKREQYLQEQSRKELARMVAERTTELEKLNQKLLRENQARRKSEAGYRRSAAQAQSLTEVSTRLNARLNLQTVLQTISQEIIQATHYPLCTVMLYDEKSDALVIESASGKFAELAMQSRPLPREAFEMYVESFGPLFVVEDISAIANNPYQDIHKQMKVRTVISLPLELEGRLVGCLNVQSLGKIHLPTEEEKTFLQGLANLATTAIINARLYQEAQEGQARLQNLSRQLVEAQETERRKLVRELHDDVGQTITYLNMLLDASLKTAAADKGLSEKMDLEVKRARKMTDEMLQRIHELSAELRPPMLDDFGLVPALLDYFENYSKQTGVQVDFKHGLPGIRFTPELENTAFRVIQQALVNVARHAKTDQVAVRIWSYENMLGLQVEDNGVGFDIQSVLNKKPTGGLPNMREQVALLGGALDIETAPGGGTCLTVEIPLAG